MQDKGHALPMVAVYLLGHKVGDIEEPVLYVNHQSFDYNDNPVTKGLPDPFVDSLTHNSIIVQIPRLRGRINNRLDMVLSFFDQTKRDENDSRLLHIDDRLYANDADMERILHRLTMAAADADIRHKMNVEDEYFSAIEKRDTEILERDHQIAEQKTRLAEQKTQLAEQKTQLAEQKTQLAEQKDMLSSTIKMLLSAGRSIEEIAATLGKSIDEIKELSV